MSSTNATSIVIKTSIAASLVGAVAALLVAPNSGRVTRSSLRSSAEGLRQKAHSMKLRISERRTKREPAVTNELSQIQEEMRAERDYRRQVPTLISWEREI